MAGGGVTASLARRMLRQPIFTIRTVLARVRHDPAWTLVKVDSLLPSALRRWLQPLAVTIASSWLRLRGGGRAASCLLAFVHATAGDEQALRAHLDQRASAPGRERIALARLLVNLDRTQDAIRLLDGLDGRSAVVARALALARAGRLRAAMELFDSVELDERAAVERARTADDLRGLDPSWDPPTPAVDAPTRAPIPRRILHLVNNALPQVHAGYTVRTQQITTVQRAEGFDPVVMTRLGFPWDRGHLDAAPVDEVDGITYHHVGPPARFAGSARHIEAATPAYAQLAADLRPAVLHATTPFENGRAALAVGAALDLPVVYEVRGFLEDTWLSRRSNEAADTDRYRLTRDMEAHVAGAAAAVVTLGETMKQDLVERGVPAKHVHVIGNAVDTETFRVRGLAAQRRARLGVEGELVVGYIGSLVGYEGLETIVDAVALLRERGHEATGLIVGSGTTRPMLEARAAARNVARHVCFPGRVPARDVPATYEAIDVFVLPRRDVRVSRMVTPIKPVEAMAMERAVVVSDLPALTEVLTPETGRAFASEDAEALATVLEQLGDADVRARLGAEARAWVLENRTLHAMGRRYRDLYESIGVPLPHVS